MGWIQEKSQLIPAGPEVGERPDIREYLVIFAPCQPLAQFRITPGIIKLLDSKASSVGVERPQVSWTRMLKVTLSRHPQKG